LLCGKQRPPRYVPSAGQTPGRGRHGDTFVRFSSVPPSLHLTSLHVFGSRTRPSRARFKLWEMHLPPRVAFHRTKLKEGRSCQLKREQNNSLTFRFKKRVTIGCFALLDSFWFHPCTLKEARACGVAFRPTSPQERPSCCGVETRTGEL